MCGIAGLLDTTAGQPPRRDELEAMVRLIEHRGPDDMTIFLEPQIGLAHARLSIIDVEGGKQPIHNEDHTVWVVFNGEIFNYLELREGLLRRGHRFATRTDTEVIVHLYEEKGERFVDELNGQFAIALWDRRQKKLVLARDRVGIAPLFYTTQQGRFAFASEVKALLPLMAEAPNLDLLALDQVMTFWTPVGPRTLFEGVSQVLPGQMVVVHGQEVLKSRYWDLKYPTDGRYDERPESEQLGEIEALMIDATRLRLRSDVPVGAYLSGGLDSSVITALCHEFVGEGMRCFSVGFEDAAFDEAPHQNVMASHLGLRRSRLDVTRGDIASRFLDAVWHAESTVLRTAPVPLMMLSEHVRQSDYKVVLTGEGADEVFGGYDIFKEAKIRLFWARQRDSEWRGTLLKRLYPYLELTRNQGQAYLQSFFGQGLDQPEAPHFAHIPRWATTASCKTFFADEVKMRLREDPLNELLACLPTEIERWHPFNRWQYIETKLLMGNYLLSSQGDRMLMANGVEGRYPYLDHRVVEFASRLHPKVKMKVLNEKYALKTSMASYLPDSIRKRSKQPYRAPDAAAFTTPQAAEYVDELLSPGRLRNYGYFDPAKVALLHRKVRRGAGAGYRDNMAFVGILSTQAWHYHFVEGYYQKLRSRTAVGF